ncbi:MULTISPECIES: hypothetical protein [Lysinibacillus]|uniref:hypothetical protein n=1 Tax=Lysinibacillus TaxID=400634 RepID=UPI001CBEA052|nr:hypothetical protein [Lysinibacillus sphaericus]
MKGLIDFMLVEIKEAFLFILDIYKGNLPQPDLYLLGVTMVILSLAEIIQEIRTKPSESKKWGIVYLKWIPISFLICSIYLSGFYFIVNMFNNVFSTPEVFHQQQSLRSIAIMSLTMASVASLIVSVWKLNTWFKAKNVLFPFIINSLFIVIGMYIINITWYEIIKLPLWCYGLIGVINTIFMYFLLWEEEEELEQMQSNNIQ